MFLAKFVVVWHLKIHPAVHLNTTKALSLLKIWVYYSKVYWKLTSFRYSYVLTRVKKGKMVAGKNYDIITLVTEIIML